MKMLFRVDASSQMGYGHLSRCMALADALGQFDIRSLFVLRERSRPAAERVLAKGHQAVVLTPPATAGEQVPNRWSDASWEVDARQTCKAVDGEPIVGVVVDQYGLDHRWERWVGHRTNAPIAVIDGVAGRRHCCELLVDPTYPADLVARRWRRLVPSHTRLLVGPRFALLRPEFGEQRRAMEDRSPTIRNILIAFGGGDAGGATELAVDAVASVESTAIDATVVAGAAAPNIESLRRRCAQRHNVTLHVDTDQMARLMSMADLGIGAGGTMMWERAYLRLPSITVAIASHQAEIAKRVAHSGAVEYLGRVDDLATPTLAKSIARLIANPDAVSKMIEATETLFDDVRQVGTLRVAEQLVEIAEHFPKGG